MLDRFHYIHSAPVIIFHAFLFSDLAQAGRCDICKRQKISLLNALPLATPWPPVSGRNVPCQLQTLGVLSQLLNPQTTQRLTNVLPNVQTRTDVDSCFQQVVWHKEDCSQEDHFCSLYRRSFFDNWCTVIDDLASCRSCRVLGTLSR